LPTKVVAGSDFEMSEDTRAFIPGHLMMRIIHGWHNFMTMLTGWKKHPAHLSE
jgi:hypothetical protein